MRETVNTGSGCPAQGATDSGPSTATYVITGDDIDAGFVANTATADSDESEPADGTTITPLPEGELPALALEKSGTFADDIVACVTTIARNPTNEGTIKTLLMNIITA